MITVCHVFNTQNNENSKLCNSMNLSFYKVSNLHHACQSINDLQVNVSRECYVTDHDVTFTKKVDQTMSKNQLLIKD